MSLRLAFARTDCTPMTHCVPKGWNSWNFWAFRADIFFGAAWWQQLIIVIRFQKVSQGFIWIETIAIGVRPILEFYSTVCSKSNERLTKQGYIHCFICESEICFECVQRTNWNKSGIPRENKVRSLILNKFIQNRERITVSRRKVALKDDLHIKYDECFQPM